MPHPPNPAPHTWRGTGVALVTPMQADGALDLPALRRLVDHLVDGGVDYLVPMGTTGESVTLSDDEFAAAVDTVLTANAGRLPVLLGCGGNDTRLVAERMRQYAQRFPVQGFLSVSPAYNKPTQEGIYQHFAALAAASPLPIVLYNVPGRTASNMLPDTVLRLAHTFPNVVAVKEASGNLEQGMRIVRDMPAHFAVLSGDDPLALPGIAGGYAGVISVVANVVPRAFSDMVRHCLAGDFAAARAPHLAMLHLTELLFREGNPAGAKAALAHLGMCGPHVRLPLVPASPQLQADLAQALQMMQMVVVGAK